MPTYEYQCESCQTYFTKILKISDMHQPESEPCSCCGKRQVKKKILTGIIFNADFVKPNQEYNNLVRQWKKDFPGNTLPDV